MNDLLRHRGPDDEGYVLFPQAGSEPRVCGGEDTPNGAYGIGPRYLPASKIEVHIDSPVQVALAHRRLAIVDLSVMGHQPICSVDGRYWIVYNGEIYNHVELREELAATGYQFLSSTDTEVVLAAFDRWGEASLEKFNGMWAFAIFDCRTGELFLARDRFGVKPLYFYFANDGLLAFASEIKAFSEIAGWRPHVNAQRAYEFLVYGLSDHTTETMFQGVSQLAPGSWMAATLDEDSGRLSVKVRLKQWYTIPATRFEGSFDDACRGVYDRFADAVRLNLRSDVPVGSCLSGGIDSSAIVCAVHGMRRSEASPMPQKTFSACSEIEALNERKWAEMVVAATGVEAHFVYPELDQLFEESPRLAWHQDEPYGSTSIFAQWKVFESAAREGVKVMLDGQGSDEQMAGYHTFFAPWLASLLRQGRLLDFAREAVAMTRLHGYGAHAIARMVASNALPAQVQEVLRRLTGYVHARPRWLNVDRLGAEPGNPFLAFGSGKSLSAFSRAQLTGLNLQMLLRWEDRNSMAHSIEARVPYLDHRLVEFVLGLPDDFKISGGQTKRVLRAALAGLVPAAILQRTDKLGFVTSEEHWMRNQAREPIRAKLRQCADSAAGILNSKEVMGTFDNIIAGRTRFNQLPWRLISFGDWMRRFAVRL